MSAGKSIIKINHKQQSQQMPGCPPILSRIWEIRPFGIVWWWFAETLAMMEAKPALSYVREWHELYKDELIEKFEFKKNKN